MLELSFHTRELRSVCEEDTQARQQIGQAAAEVLRHRLEDLRAADTVFDVLVGNLRLDASKSDGSAYLLDLDEGWILQFRANHARLPVAANGMVDWLRVSRIKIMGISRATSTAEDRTNA